MEEKKLYRSTTNKMLGGVLAGLAEHFNIDPSLLRILYCALSLFTAGFPGLLLYLLMLIIVPQKPEHLR